MAEETEILVYPSLRISELEARRLEARQKYQTRRDQTVQAAGDFLHPTNLLRNHKGSLAAAAVSFLLFGKLFAIAAKFVAPKLKSTAVWSVVKAGWMWKALEISYGLYKMTSKKKGWNDG